jgi:GNAT superfamily N-acetyltransferase
VRRRAAPLRHLRCNELEPHFGAEVNDRGKRRNAASVDRGTAGRSRQGPNRPTVHVHNGADPSVTGNWPGTARRGTPINTATTCGADSASISDDADFDGTSARRLVRIREIGPGDGDVVDEVFAGLSPYSRYLRFQAPIAELSAATRRSLTALDGRTHVALAAFSQSRPIGIVRIIDLGDGRGEVAVEVIDCCQGCGVGTELLQAARNRAAELGFRELVGEMLVVNAAVLAALRRVFAVVRVRRDGSELTVTMPVDGEPAPAIPVERLVA